MVRLDNWQNNLSAIIEKWRNNPFDFPTANCLIWVSECIKAVTGEDILVDYAGKYTTEKQAASLLRKTDKVKTSQELLELKLQVAPKSIAFARHGDIVLVDPNQADIELPSDIELFGLVPGICYGPISFFLGEFGLVKVETLKLGQTLWVS